MKIRRIISLIFSLLALFSLFSGCSGNKKEASSTQGNSPKEKEYIQFFTWSLGSQSVIDPMVKRFNEINGDNIEVEVIYKSGSWQTALRTSILSGQAPDLLYGTPDLIESISNDWIEPWDDYLLEETKERIRGHEYRVVVDGEPRTYGFFWNTKTYRLAYNKDIFKEVGIAAPPKNWKEFYEISKRITERGAGKYFGTAIPMKGEALSFWLIPAMSLEGRYNDGYNYLSNQVDVSPLSSCIGTLRRMVWESIVFPGSETMDNDAVRAQFAAGKIGMLPTVSWDVGAINIQFDATCNWEVAPFLVPADGEKGLLTLREGANYQLSASSSHKEAVAKFMDFLLGDEYLSELYSAGTDLVTIPSALELAKSKPAPYHQWEAYAPTDREASLYPLIDVVKTLTGDGLTEVAKKLILDPDLDIDRELEDFNQRATEGIIQRALTDGAKAEQAGLLISKVGKIPVVDEYDPMKPIDLSKVRYVTAEEWRELQK